ncbi:MAG: sugar ABC transporter permease [Spirochaetes bacterium]|nr:sugar ABC transporter permease [Spirochaetota bacterium]
MTAATKKTGARGHASEEVRFAALLLAPCLLVALLFAFYPILYSLYLSLGGTILSLPGSERIFMGAENFIELFHDTVARAALAHTLIFVIVSTALEVMLGLGIALVINRSFRGRGVLRAAVLVPWAIPTVVASQMWRFIFNDNYGLLNYVVFGADPSSFQAWLADPAMSFVAIIIADVWKTSSFAALIMLAGLQMIPDELYESALIDGAGAWQRFKSITLPLVRSSLLIALLFRTLDAFRVFDLVFVMTQGGPADATNVLQFYGYRKIFAEGFLGYGSAISVLVFFVSCAVCVFYIRALGMKMFGADE